MIAPRSSGALALLLALACSTPPLPVEQIEQAFCQKGPCELPLREVSVQGPLRILGEACTKEECPRERPCCNVCTGSPALGGAPGSFHVALKVEGMSCRGNSCFLECPGLTTGDTYIATGVFDRGGAGATLAVRELRRQDGKPVGIQPATPARLPHRTPTDILAVGVALVLVSMAALLASARVRGQRAGRLLLGGLGLAALTLGAWWVPMMPRRWESDTLMRLGDAEHPWTPLPSVLAPALFALAYLVVWFWRIRREPRWWLALAFAVGGAGIAAGLFAAAVAWFWMPALASGTPAKHWWIALVACGMGTAAFLAVALATLGLGRASAPER